MAEKPVALVTGASSGIGAAFARRLGRDGYEVILVARRRDRLQELAGEIGSARVLVADLSDGAGIEEVVAAAQKEDRLEIAINNAGFGGYSPFVDLDPHTAEDLIAIHCIATARICRAALPGMIDRGRGAVINVASMLAFSKSIPPGRLPFRATYAGCKAFMVTFTSQLAYELEGTGVQAQVLCPGLVETEFHGENWQGPPRMPAEDVVTASLKALQLKEVICAPPITDPSTIDRLNEAEQNLFADTILTKLADRYLQ